MTLELTAVEFQVGARRARLAVGSTVRFVGGNRPMTVRRFEVVVGHVVAVMETGEIAPLDALVAEGP